MRIGACIMKRLISLLVICALTLICLTACEYLPEELNKIIESLTDGTGSSQNGNQSTDTNKNPDGTEDGKDAEKDENKTDGDNPSITVYATVNLFDADGRLNSKELKLEIPQGSLAESPEKWIESKLTPWARYRYKTCFDISVNGSPVSKGYALADGDRIDLTEKEPLFTVTLNFGYTSKDYPLCSSIVANDLFDMLAASGELGAHSIEAFYNMYTVKCNDEELDKNTVISQNMEIKLYINEALYELTVLSPEGKFDHIAMYSDANLYKILTNDLAQIMQNFPVDKYDIYFGHTKLGGLDDAKNYTVNEENDLLVFREKKESELKISVGTEHSFVAKAGAPYLLEEIFPKYMGLTYEEILGYCDTEVPDSESIITDGFLCGSYLMLRFKDKGNPCEIKYDAYNDLGSLMYSETYQVQYGTLLAYAGIFQINENAPALPENLYLNGNPLDTSLVYFPVFEDITLEEKPPIYTPPAPTWKVQLNVDADDELFRKYEFLCEALGAPWEEESFSNKSPTFDKALTFDEALRELFGYSYLQLMRMGILPSVSSSGAPYLRPDETLGGIYHVTLEDGYAVDVSVYRDFNGSKYPIGTFTAHSRMKIKSAIEFSDLLSTGSLTADTFKNKKLLHGENGSFLSMSQINGWVLDDVIDNREEVESGERAKLTLTVTEYDQFTVKIYHGDTFIKSVTYNYVVEAPDLFATVDGYNENSCCHVNGYIYTGESFHMHYIYYDATIIIYDEYTPGVEEEKGKLEH